jgi:hypothetical protein
MTINNRAEYGFRFYRSLTGAQKPTIEWVPIATAYNGSITGGSAIDINVGDPVVRLSTGYFQHAAGSETTAVAPYGIVVAIGKVWDGALMQSVNKVVNQGGAYGTNLTRQTQVGVIPVDQAYWEVDADDNVTATTLAGYLALYGENTNHVLTTGSEPLANPLLDISLHNTTALIWRIVKVSDTVENKDFSGTRVKLIVRSNVAQMPWSSSTGI